MRCVGDMAGYTAGADGVEAGEAEDSVEATTAAESGGECEVNL